MSVPGEARPFEIVDLVRDPRFQIRKKLDLRVVDEYVNVIAAGAVMPPVTVALVDGVPYLVDGWHRVAAHEASRQGYVMAVFVEAKEREARWLAAAANLKHGLRLKGDERREAFRAYVTAQQHLKPKPRREGPHPLKSYREIAKELGGGVRHTTIRFWMQKYCHGVFLRMGGGEGSPENDPPGPEHDPERAFQEKARTALQEALAAARGVRNPDRRGDLLRVAEGVVKAIREGGEWRLPEF